MPAVASGSVRKHSWRVTWRWWGITGRWWWRVARRPWLVTRWPWWWGIWTSRLQQALTERAAIFGDWVVGPTVLGPASFAQAGYDYVGFDCQHGYLDDADMAGLLRQLEHVPIATVVRLASNAPAPIGRILDAGADAVVIAMVETGEQAADAGGRRPVRPARRTQLRSRGDRVDLRREAPQQMRTF